MEDGGLDTGGVLGPLDNDKELFSRSRWGNLSSKHRRSVSGSLLSRLPILRMSARETGPSERDDAGDHDLGDDVSPITRGHRAMASALQQQRRTRRRRGSLRKTALLGTRPEFREKKPAASSRAMDVARDGSGAGRPSLRGAVEPVSPENELTPRSSFDHISAMSRSGWSFPNEEDDKPLDPSSAAHRPTPSLSKTSMVNEEGGTDDEDVVSLPHLHNSNTGRSSSTTTSNEAAGMIIPTPPSSSESYFSVQLDVVARQRRLFHRTKSPLATHPVEAKGVQDISWDYSETEWWGWIILVVTWLVFVVGMGSCFGVWSWAWNVGMTPYAPPEFHDDPTLPIVGYYPALIVMTAIMSWVWVIVAWIGMKYFKHANISGDDV